MGASNSLRRLLTNCSSNHDNRTSQKLLYAKDLRVINSRWLSCRRCAYSRYNKHTALPLACRRMGEPKMLVAAIDNGCMLPCNNLNLPLPAKLSSWRSLVSRNCRALGRLLNAHLILSSCYKWAQSHLKACELNILESLLFFSHVRLVCFFM